MHMGQLEMVEAFSLRPFPFMGMFDLDEDPIPLIQSPRVGHPKEFNKSFKLQLPYCPLLYVCCIHIIALLSMNEPLDQRATARSRR